MAESYEEMTKRIRRRRASDNYPPNHVDEVDPDDEVKDLAVGNEWLTDGLHREADRQVLKYAVQRKIFTDCCGGIADVRKNVLFEIAYGENLGFKLYCLNCVVGTVAESVERIEKAVEGATVKVYDGKVLWSK